MGPSDSDKSSWFAPFEGIIPLHKMAVITNDGRFSAADISQDTEIVIVDEWSSNVFDATKRNKFFKGNNVVATKTQNAAVIKYNSGFFITSNAMPELGQRTCRSCDGSSCRIQNTSLLQTD